MSKNKSTDTLVRLSHGESVETIELENRINLLEHMLTKPTKSKRDAYVASHLYDKRGNLDADRWEYQLLGTAAITSVPIVLIFGAATGVLLSGANDLTLFLASSGIVAAEALAVGTTNAYMTIKGSKMNTEIRQALTSNLISLGYQITPNNENLIHSIKSYKTNNERLLNREVISTRTSKYIHLIEEDEFVARIANLIDYVLANQYPRYEDDISELKCIATDWIAINAREYERTGKKLDITHAPTYLYDALENEILNKVNKTLKKVSK